LDIQAKGETGLKQEDEVLMLAYAQGDASAFDELYGRHKGGVYRFFSRQNLATAVAEELTHDTWLRVINARENYQATAKFTTYLFTIARRIAADHNQKKSNLLERNEEDKAIQELAENNSNSNEQTDLALALKQQIIDLPIEQREVFLLKQEAGFSIDEIAEIIAQNREKVKSRWRYALQKLRKGLSLYVD